MIFLVSLSWAESKKKQPAQGRAPRNLTEQPGGYWSANKPASSIEGYEIHTVKQGDTLWDITKQYLNDPFLWPQIWEMNGSILDPHWIYPGDRVMIKKMMVMAPPTPAPAPSRSETPEAKTQPSLPARAVKPETAVQALAEQPGTAAQAPPSLPQPLSAATFSELYCSGFFSSEKLNPISVVVGGEESDASKSLMSDRDIVYLSHGTSAGIKPGDELQVVRPYTQFYKWGTDFARASNKSKYGYYYQDKGRLRVLLAQENSATAEVIFACEEILGGDLITPGEQRVSPPQRTGVDFDKFAPPNNKTAGKIFMSKEFRKLLGAGHIVYIDVGGKQNVQVGDYFRITRHFKDNTISLFNRGDYRKYQAAFDSIRKVIGELVILRVDSNTATALITHSRQDVMLGDGVELE